MDPRVWERKYLIEFSPVFISVWNKIKGMKAIVFNSKASHAVNRDEVENIMKTLAIIHKEYKRTEGEIIGEGVEHSSTGHEPVSLF